MPFKLVIKAQSPVPTIPKLSELSVDVDKDWQGKGIRNLKEVTQGMAHGDLVVKLGETLSKLSPAYGTGTNFLHIKDAGDGKYEPEWLSILSFIVNQISQLAIDADKDWQGKGIYNLREVASGMVHGDLAFKSGQTLTRLPPVYGVGTHFLHVRSLGDGRFEPEWADIQGLVAYLSGSIRAEIHPAALNAPQPSIGWSAATAVSGSVQSSKSLGIPMTSILGVAELM